MSTEARVGAKATPKYVTHAELGEVLTHLTRIFENHETALRAHKARLDAVESSPPAPVWCGVHEPGKSYARGALVTRQGALWLARSATRPDEVPGVGPSPWVLICKSHP